MFLYKIDEMFFLIIIPIIPYIVSSVIIRKREDHCNGLACSTQQPVCAVPFGIFDTKLKCYSPADITRRGSVRYIYISTDHDVIIQTPRKEQSFDVFEFVFTGWFRATIIPFHPTEHVKC